MSERLENFNSTNLSHNLGQMKEGSAQSLLNKLFGEGWQSKQAEMLAAQHELTKQSPAPPEPINPALQELARQRCTTPDCDCSAAFHCLAYTTGQFMPDKPAAPTKQAPWIGVDLDGTLALYDGWKGIDHIGEPVPAMQARVKAWLAEGKHVKIFTARVFDPTPEVQRPIEAWCRKHLGRVLPITCVKDMAMTELWDDRAIQVNINTGQRADGKE